MIFALSEKTPMQHLFTVDDASAKSYSLSPIFWIWKLLQPLLDMGRTDTGSLYSVHGTQQLCPLHKSHLHHDLRSLKTHQRGSPTSPTTASCLRRTTFVPNLDIIATTSNILTAQLVQFLFAPVEP